MVGTAEQSTGHAVYRIPDRIPTDHPEHRHLVYQPENRNVVRSQRTERQIDNDQHGHHFETGKRVVARQMHKAILDYMNSDAFRPTANIAPELIQELFTKVAGDVKSYTKDSPDELKPKIN